MALQEAAALRAAVVHGDRDVSETLSRLADTVSLPGILRSLSRFPTPPPHLSRVIGATVGMEEAIERLKNRDTVAALTAFLREVNPSAVRVMLDERDDILTKALRGCTGRVVGVVGLAHVDGIEKRWAEADGTTHIARLPAGG